MYAKFFKRFFDIVLSFIALVCLSPFLLIFIIVGAIGMKGNPFFTQERPGRIDKKTGEEKIFKLLKFRTMTNEKDKDGNLLPDEVRLNKYGKFLRSTSCDELPSLINILKGDISIVGPRPLLVRYLPYYTEQERKRHTVRPGLTGYAQANGRNAVNWEERFQMDVWYTEHLTLMTDIKVILTTVKSVLKSDGIVLNQLEDFDAYRENQRKNADSEVGAN